jgi:hypothetical protein
MLRAGNDTKRIIQLGKVKENPWRKCERLKRKKHEKTKYNTQIVLALLAVSFLALELSALAQSVTSLRTIGNVKTDSRILYHNGLVLVGLSTSILSGMAVGTTIVGPLAG